MFGFFIYLKGRENQTDRNILSASPLPKCLQLLGLHRSWEKLPGRSTTRVSLVGGRDPSTWAITAASQDTHWQEVESRAELGLKPKHSDTRGDLIHPMPPQSDHFEEFTVELQHLTFWYGKRYPKLEWIPMPVQKPTAHQTLHSHLPPLRICHG